jgi:hypothetical protein
MTLRDHVKEVLTTNPGVRVHDLASLVNRRINLGYTETRRRVHALLIRMEKARQVTKTQAETPPTGGGKHPCYLWRLA